MREEVQSPEYYNGAQLLGNPGFEVPTLTPILSTPTGYSDGPGRQAQMLGVQKRQPFRMV